MILLRVWLEFTLYSPYGPQIFYALLIFLAIILGGGYFLKIIFTDEKTEVKRNDFSGI